MKNHEMVMSIRESQRLEELEKLIAKGQKTFVEVGLALAEIRALRLYKREYSNFQEYCQKKWGWARRYTEYVIAGAEAVQSLPEKMRTIVRSEAATFSTSSGRFGSCCSPGNVSSSRGGQYHLPPEFRSAYGQRACPEASLGVFSSAV